MLSARSFGSTLFAFCGLMIAAFPAQCSEKIIPASADSFIINDAEAIGFNYGSTPFLIAYNDGGVKISSLLKFDLPKINPTKIHSASLRLWSQGWKGDYSNTATTSLFAMAMPWHEDEVTWSSRISGLNWSNPGGDITAWNSNNPAFAVNTSGMTIPSGGADLMEWDVTQLVKLWASGTIANNGLRIDTASGIFFYESRESDFPEMQPTLIIISDTEEIKTSDNTKPRKF